MLLRSAPISEVLKAIHLSIERPLNFNSRRLKEAIALKNRDVGLTPREIEMLEKLPTGDTVQQIAAQLFVTESTVKTHLSAVYKKLGASNRVQAINAARKLGLLP